MMTNVNPTVQSEIDLNAAIAQQYEGNRFEEAERRGVRDARTGRFITHKDYGGDTDLNVAFSTEAVHSKKETLLAGGVPKYVDMDFITITIPTDQTLGIHAPVTDFYQFRFPREYAAFKAGQDAALIGTPLEIWAALKPSQIQELKNAGVRSIEQLANLSDSASGVLRGFYSLKQSAKLFLEESKDKAAAGALRAQLDESEARHKADLKAMEERFSAMLESLVAKQKPAKAEDKKQS